MKKFFERLLKNALHDLCSSVAGCVAGADDLLTGIGTHDTAKIVKGSALIFLGLITKSND